MFSLELAEPQTFTDERTLRAAFGTETVFLAPGATLRLEGRMTVGPNVVFEGNCTMGSDCRIEQSSALTNVTLGRDNRVRPQSILYDIVAGNGNLLGPFCFLRDGCVIASECILGAHVEAARSRFADGVKISHRAFIGDADIGEETIIGAGVVFCNFDRGARRHTSISRAVTIGSGTLLVPPLSIREGAVIAAGSVITKDVPAGAKIIQKRL